MIELRPRRNRG